MYVSKRGGGGKKNPKPPTLSANGMPLSYQQPLPNQILEIAKIKQDMKLGFEQQQLQLKQIQSHINQPLPATLPEDRRLYPTMAYPIPPPVQIATNVNPEHERELNQRRTIDPALFPYASSALSSGLVEIANQERPFAFSGHQTPVSRRGSLSNFIQGELNRPDALTIGEALHGNRMSLPIPEAHPFFAPFEPVPRPFNLNPFVSPGRGRGAPSKQEGMERMRHYENEYLRLREEKEEEDQPPPAPPRKMKHGGKVKKAK